MRVERKSKGYFDTKVYYRYQKLLGLKSLVGTITIHQQGIMKLKKLKN